MRNSEIYSISRMDVDEADAIQWLFLQEKAALHTSF